MNTLTNSASEESAIAAMAASGDKCLAMIAAQRRQVQIVRQELSVREANLHAYEERLRALQEQIKATRSAPGRPLAPSLLASEHSLAEAASEALPARYTPWQKLRRARELLEAEQAHLRDDRLALRDQALALQQREEALAAREADLLARETALAAAETPVVAQ